MIVAGGIYREECIIPAWSRIYGSGGRAAAAISGLSQNCVLHAYASEAWINDARLSMESLGIKTDLTKIAEDIGFNYLHPLSDAQLSVDTYRLHPPLTAEGEVVLRFGILEGSARVKAKRAVYDPQNASQTLDFHANGSSADSLAIVLNETELLLSVGKTGTAGAALVREKTGAEVVVVKRGPFGATVYQDDNETSVPAHKSEFVFKIGSGDVFSAIFAYYWGEQNLSAAMAAAFASKAVSKYVATKDVQSALTSLEIDDALPTTGQVKEIYLAGPFFNLAQRWMVEESRHTFSKLGAKVFSPLHEVGLAGDPTYIATKDLEGLKRCACVFAIVDGEDAGTLFEVGYARSLGIPVVVLAESTRPESLTMLTGSGCFVTSDFTTAIYHAIWGAMG